MIWRLTYCNKKGVEARVDIIKGDRTSVEIVQGSANPFTLSYKLDKNDKSGHIMTSSADIEIFETETFNIDDLKTSNETELKVEYFEGNILAWSGFILPDFFSREIGSPNIVRMTASDRLTALKGVTLSDLPIRVSLRDLIELSLAQTGLELALVAQIQINQGSTNILDAEILSQRLTDTRGRSISCYDILMSIMVATNSTIRQRKGQWVVYNKLEHELRTPTIFFDKVERGAIRTIQPVASSVGVYHEHGGGLTYPTNYNFSDGLNGWTAVNGFVASVNDKRVEEFELIGNSLHPIYGDITNVNYLVNKNEQYMANASAPYIVSEQITIPYPVNSEVAISVDMNAISAVYPPESLTVSRVDFVVVATKGSDILFLNKEGVFTEADNNLPVISSHMHRMVFSSTTPYIAISRQMTVNGVLTVEDGFVSDYTISVRIYGSGTAYTALINSVAVRFNKTKDTPKGTIFKTTQGSNFTKLHDVETAILGDYITSGLNGYFYDYPIDDSSNLYLPSGTLSSPTWITAFDTTERPLLHHISRQKSRLFSVAHDILKANINVESFDPLAVFQDCKGGKYVVVSASFDFLRSEVDVELEQIAYDNTILKRDFIYSYFGEGESNIKSIGGIAGGGGGTGGGGGMTSEQLEMLTNLASWWKLDEENDAVYSEKSVYSLKGVSALGLGSEGGGSGGGFDRLDKWVDYDSSKSGWVLSALLGYDLHTRVNDLEAGAGDSNIDIDITGSGNAVTDVSKSGNTLTFDKGINFALATHNHVIANITGLQDALDEKEPAFTKNNAFNKNFGTTAGTVAQGNDSRILNGQTAYGWGDHAGLYPTLSVFNNHANNNAANQKHLSDTQLAYLNNLISWWKLDEDGNLYTEKNLYSTKGVSALGLGDGGSSGGGVDMLDSWANYTSAKADYYVPASLLVPFRNDTLNRLTSLEGGSATSIDTTGSGNAITSVSKSGNTLTFAKGSTFSLSTHNHDTVYKPIGYVPSWSEITGKPPTFTPSSHTHTIAQITGLQGALDSKATQSDISTAIDGIEIGGRNLLTESVFLTSGTKVTKNGLLGIYIQHGVGKIFNSLTFEPNTQYSFYVDKEPYPAQDNDLVVQCWYTDGTYQDIISYGTTRMQNSFVSSKDKTIESIRKTFHSGGSIFYAFQITKMRYKATDWTPAPEDQVSDWSTTDVTSFSFIKNKPTQLSQFTDNIGVGSHISNKANPHAVTTAQIGAVDLTTNQTIGGVKSFTNKLSIKGINASFNRDIDYNGDHWIRTILELTNSSYTVVNNFKINAYGDEDDYRWVGIGFDGDSNRIFLTKNNVGIGTNSPAYKLDVSGTGRFTSSLITPKVDFGNGFTIEPSGTELVFKYNGVIKQRMLSNGTILATGGITALST